MICFSYFSIFFFVFYNSLLPRSFHIFLQIFLLRPNVFFFFAAIICGTAPLIIWHTMTYRSNFFFSFVYSKSQVYYWSRDKCSYHSSIHYHVSQHEGACRFTLKRIWRRVCVHCRLIIHTQNIWLYIWLYHSNKKRL